MANSPDIALIWRKLAPSLNLGAPPTRASFAQSPCPVLKDAQPPLNEYFNSLLTSLGPQHWWPGRDPFEVIAGARLSQNTSWTNVELVLGNLREAALLVPPATARVPLRRLQQLIRSSGLIEVAGKESR